MSQQSEARSGLRRLGAVAGFAGVLVLVFVLANARTALSWVQPRSQSKEQRLTETQARRRKEVENAPWMAPGIPMTERLAAIAKDRKRCFKFFDLPNAITSLEKSLDAEQIPEKKATIGIRIVAAQLQVGRVMDALESLRGAEETLDHAGIADGSPIRQRFLWWKGIANLRLGEQDNCIGNHSAESCIVPIRGNGIYKEKRGPEAAIEAYKAYLKNDPEDLGARWLLNIACMNIGIWPDQVPPEWLIGPETFKSDYDIKRFINLAPATGLDSVSISGGSILEDLDHDGFLDVVVSAMGIEDQMRYFHNNGDGTFIEQTKAAGLLGELGGLNMVHADYDNDGWSDIYIIRGAWMGMTGRHPDSLLHNDGPDPQTGILHFTDVTEEAGLLAFYPSQTAAWGDYDNDGWLDIYVGSESVRDPGYPSLLFRNNGKDPATGRVTFTEVGETSGLRHFGYVKGVVWGDYDNDGRLDLYVSQLYAPNVLYHNDGPMAGAPDTWTFSNVTEKAGVGLPISSFPTFWFDYDNDGWQDLLATSRTGTNVGEEEGGRQDPLYMIVAHHLGRKSEMESPRLYHNRGDGTFEDVTEAMGLQRPIYAMGMNSGDLDNDGWLDFYVGTGNPNLSALVPNLMFRNDAAKRFQDVTTSGGFGNLQKGHGIAWGDIDNDGDQDIFEELGAAWPADVAAHSLFLNPGHGGHWVTLVLEGVQDNAQAIGARVRVVVQRTDGSEWSLYRTVGTGGSFGSSSIQQEIGLGDARRIVRVEVFWPAAGRTEVFQDVPMDQFVRLREGDPEPRIARHTIVPMPVKGALDVYHHHPPVVK